MGRERPRWWPAFGLALSGATAWLVVRLFVGDDQQQRWISEAIVLTLTGLALIVWFLFASRLSRAIRLAGLALLVAAALAIAALYEVRGFSGDMRPILARRGATPDARVGEARQMPSDWDGADFPQFLGPDRDGSFPGLAIGADWQADPPRLLWSAPIGEGWSGFAVADGIAVTLAQDGDDETIVALDMADGAVRWQARYPARHDDPLGGPGPRGTPSIADGVVYALGGTGILSAHALSDGRALWRVDTIADNRSSAPTYGVAASPLVLDDAVVVLAGGGMGRSLVAYSREHGERLWSGGNDPAAYSSPVLIEGAIVVLNDRALVAHDPADGRPLWSLPWPSGTEKASQPLALPGERLFVSTGYGIGGTLYDLSVDPPRVLWQSRALKAKFTNVVHKDGFLYGLDDGILVCVDAATGERRWKRGRYGHGQTLLIGEQLLIQAENGDLALVDASPEAFRERARIPALDGKCWNHPALAMPYLVVRNDRSARAYRLPAAP